MCGRFVRAKKPPDYQRLFGVSSVPDLPSYNVAPTQAVAVVRSDGDARSCAMLRWGLIPSWAKDKKTLLINARAETLFEKPAFRAAAKRRRCLILADGYFEWKTNGKAKQPYYFRLAADTPFAFAGIWETWKGEAEPLESCAIVTTTANDLSRSVHDRMPVMLRENDAAAWIDAGIEEPAALAELLRPFDTDRMTCYPVRDLVNSFKNNSPACIEPA